MMLRAFWGGMRGYATMSPLFLYASQCIQDVLVDNAWSSPTHLADFISKRNAVFTESHLRSQRSIGSNGCCVSVLKTRLRSHVDMLTVGAGCNCWAPFRKQVIRICDIVIHHLFLHVGQKFQPHKPLGQMEPCYCLAGTAENITPLAQGSGLGPNFLVNTNQWKASTCKHR